MKTQTENVVCIYDQKGELTGILRRDAVSGKKVIYLTTEADTEDIERIINPDKTLI
jgi:hypothetical protein